MKILTWAIGFLAVLGIAAAGCDFLVEDEEGFEWTCTCEVHAEDAVEVIDDFEEYDVCVAASEDATDAADLGVSDCETAYEAYDVVECTCECEETLATC